MAFKTRGVTYEAKVTGFDRAERAIEGTDRAAQDASKSADRLGGNIAGAGRDAEQAARSFQKAEAQAAGLNDKVKNGLTGFDEFAGRLGQVGNALNLLSGVAIVGLVTGLADGVRALWEMTETGQAAKIASEAQAAAVDKHVGKLRELTKVTWETIDATFAAIRAEALKETVGAKLVERYVKITEAEAAVGNAIRNTGILREREIEQLERAGTSERKRAEIKAALSTAIRRSEEAQKAAIETLTAERAAYEADAQTVALLNQELERLAKVVTPETVTASTDRAAALEAEAKAARDLLDFVSDLNVEAAYSEAFGSDGIDPEALFGDLVSYAEAQADAVIDTFRRIGFAAGEKAGKVEDASAQEASAYAASTAAALGAAASLAESLGASSAVVAAIKIAENIAAATEAGAKALVAGAEGNIPAAIAYGAGAVEHIAAAIDWGADALGGGGKGAVPSSPGGTPPPLSDSARDRTLGSGGTGEMPPTVVNVNFAGQSLHTDRDVQRAVRAALKESESSTGLPAPNFARIGRV